MNVDSDPEAELALENLKIISMRCVSSREVHSDVHAQVRTGNLDIIPTSCRAVFLWRPGGLMVFRPF